VRGGGRFQSLAFAAARWRLLASVFRSMRARDAVGVTVGSGIGGFEVMRTRASSPARTRAPKRVSAVFIIGVPRC